MAKCKECGGNNAKKLSVIEKLGTQTGTARGSGVGMTGGGVGVGFHSTNINTKSDIARESQFKPTTEMKMGSLGVIGAGIALIVCIFTSFAMNIFRGIFWGFIVWCFFLIIEAFTKEGQENLEKYNKELEKEKKRYEKTWMCLDCGYKWVGRK